MLPIINDSSTCFRKNAEMFQNNYYSFDVLGGDWSSNFLRFLVLCAVKLSCPLSLSELESESSSLLLELLLELEELLELSLARPDASLTLILSAICANSGSTS